VNRGNRNGYNGSNGHGRGDAATRPLYQSFHWNEPGALWTSRLRFRGSNRGSRVGLVYRGTRRVIGVWLQLAVSLTQAAIILAAGAAADSVILPALISGVFLLINTTLNYYLLRKRVQRKKKRRNEKNGSNRNRSYRR